MSEMITTRSAEVVTTEIKAIEKQLVRAVIYGYIEIGRLLTEAKQIVGHGGWGKYLEENVKYSQQWATNLMNLYNEYGDQQESLFQSTFANSKSFGNLDVTKHVLLLKIPAEEREAFVESTDAEHKSTRELEQAIRERNEAELRREEAERIAADSQKEAASAVADAQEYKERMEAAQRAEKAAEDKVTDLMKHVKAARKDAEKAQKELEELRTNPTVPQEVMEQMQKEAAAQAAASLQADFEAKLVAAQQEAEKAHADKVKVLAEQLESSQKALALANPAAVAFKVKFDDWQKKWKEIYSDLQQLQKDTPELGKGLTAAVRALLTNYQDQLGK